MRVPAPSICETLCVMVLASTVDHKQQLQVFLFLHRQKLSDSEQKKTDALGWTKWKIFLSKKEAQKSIGGVELKNIADLTPTIKPNSKL